MRTERLKSILGMLLLLSSVNSKAQQMDSTFIYSYECTGCGTFQTVSIEPIELETEANTSTAILPDTNVSTVTQFSSSSLRKASSTVFNHNKNIFNVHPNPIKNSYFLYFESKESCTADLQIADLLGRSLVQDKIELKKGMNVFERTITNLPHGNYFIKVLFQNKIFVEKVLIKN